MHVINATSQPQTQALAQPRHDGGNARMAGTVPKYQNSVSQQTGQQAHPASFANQLRAGPESEQAASRSNDGFGLDSIVDAVNPLQHLPVVGTIYREITGDDLGPVARVAGGALYGGAVGAAVGAGNAALEYGTGEDMAGHAMSALNATDKQARTPEHTHPNTPEARVANAVAAYGRPTGEAAHNDRQTHNSMQREDHAQPAHIRQSSYNG